ncbi:MAG: hypothetical protein JXR94_05585 [Candidatus Hydrogenedentes bacterium]|nr:hypothetical protein [Candidatus Hydrogenedentota bacterium]
MGKHIIYGIHVRDRVKEAGEVQQIFTDYGCNIKTRLGLHRVQGDVCAPGGLIVLEMFGDEAACREMKARLAAIDGIEVKEMVFEH